MITRDLRGKKNEAVLKDLHPIIAAKISLKMMPHQKFTLLPPISFLPFVPAQNVEIVR